MPPFQDGRGGIDQVRSIAKPRQLAPSQCGRRQRAVRGIEHSTAPDISWKIRSRFRFEPWLSHTGCALRLSTWRTTVRRDAPRSAEHLWSSMNARKKSTVCTIALPSAHAHGGIVGCVVRAAVSAAMGSRDSSARDSRFAPTLGRTSAANGQGGDGLRGIVMMSGTDRAAERAGVRREIGDWHEPAVDHPSQPHQRAERCAARCHCKRSTVLSAQPTRLRSYGRGRPPRPTSRWPGARPCRTATRRPSRADVPICRCRRRKTRDRSRLRCADLINHCRPREPVSPAMAPDRIRHPHDLAASKIAACRYRRPPR